MESLKYAWCALKNRRLCSFISILGLAVGIACVIVIAKQIRQELTTDRFHSGIDRIYCLMKRESAQDRYALTGYWSPGLLFRNHPQIEAATNIRCFRKGDLSRDNHIYQADVLVVDSTFGQVFSFPMKAGNLQTALSAPDHIVITEQLARQIFGHPYPIGETLVFWGFSYHISGILKDLPPNSSFTFDVLVPTREEFYTRMASSWISVKEGYDITSATMPENQIFYPFRELYFNEYLDKGMLDTLRTGDKHTLWVLSWIGLVIFVISLFNYINIYQVTLLQRGRVLAVKKVFGADQRLLYHDFWVENLLIVSVSVLLALGLVLLASGIIYRELGLVLMADWNFDLLFLGAILLFIPLLIAWEAWLKYRKISPGDAMKTGYMGHRSGWVRKGLLSAQYVMTTLMIIIVLYFIRQLDYMLGQDIGLKQENIVQVPMFKSIRYAVENDHPEMLKQFWADHTYVQNALMTDPDFQFVCQGNFPLEVWLHGWGNTQKGTDLISCPTEMVVPEYLSLFGLEMKEGRFFDAELDLYQRQKVVINEAALKFFDIRDWRNTILESESWGKYEILGIVKNFRFQHAAKDIQPLVLVYTSYNEAPFLMHIQPGKEQAALNTLRKLHEK
ncbi:MAG: ABC transporter permease [Odoribacter splanchnicus]